MTADIVPRVWGEPETAASFTYKRQAVVAAPYSLEFQAGDKLENGAL